MSKVSQAELLNSLKELTYQYLIGQVLDDEGNPIHISPRDLAALGNLVLKLQEREDKLATETDLEAKVVAFPALPEILPTLRGLP